MFSGCQFSLYPMSDNFVDVILPAIEAMGQTDDLRIETDDLSTLVVGPPSRVFEVVSAAYAAACKAGGHVVLSALFSRGCPGEPDDPICIPDGPSTAFRQRQPGTPTGVEIDAQFSLYPLGLNDYMTTIGRVVNEARDAGVLERSKNFCTRLNGDITEVMTALENAFNSAARDTGHVVIHVTASKGSPSKKS